MNYLVYEAISPSNIAFLKYCGKDDANKQWPANDSFSMSLDKSLTCTRAQVHISQHHQFYYKGILLTKKDSFFKYGFIL